MYSLSLAACILLHTWPMLLLDASGVRLSFLVVLPFLPQNFDLGHKLAFSTAGPSGWRWREREIYTCWIFTDFPNPDHAKKISMHRILKFRVYFLQTMRVFADSCSILLKGTWMETQYPKRWFTTWLFLYRIRYTVQMNALTHVVIGSCLFISCHEFKLCFFPLVLTCLKHMFEVRLLQRNIDFVRSRQSREEVPDVK